MNEELKKVHAFLLGEGTLDSLNFSERDAEHKAPYWWRNNLRAAIASQAPRQALTQPDPEWPAGEREAFRLGAASGPNAVLVEALEKIITMNVQYAIDRYGDAKMAETMGCVVTARHALAAVGVEP